MEDSFNPFRDPVVPNNQTRVVVTQNSGGNVRPTVHTDVIDDYEPFRDQPAIIHPVSEAPPPPRVTVDNLEKMERELEERSRRLTEEEERLRNSGKADSINNFPPLPKCCYFKPCFYQAIDIEIPEHYRLILRQTFYLWMAYSLTLFINIFGTMANMIVQGTTNDTGTLFGLSILYLFLFVPLSYLCWFRPLYKAFKSNSSLNFFLFFIIFACQIIVLIIQDLGIYYFGACGWIISISAGTKSVGLMVFMIIIASLFTLETLACFYIIFKVNTYFRNSGGSIQKAKEEMSQDAASSSTVRSAALGIFRSKS